jgi:hypothetical protein
MQHANIILHNQLLIQKQPHKVDQLRFPSALITPSLNSRDARATNGKVVFITNKAVPVTTVSKLFSAVTLLKHFLLQNPEDFNLFVPQCNNTLCSLSYLSAIDNNKDTYWIAPTKTQSGDYFGFDLLDIGNRKSIALLHGHSYQDLLSVEISLDGKNWKRISNYFLQITATFTNNESIYNFTALPPSLTQWRFIRFVASYGLEQMEHFQVHNVVIK